MAACCKRLRQGSGRVSRLSIKRIGSHVSFGKLGLMKTVRLFSGNYPFVKGAGVEAILNKDTGIIPAVNNLIEWPVACNFYKPSRKRGDIDVTMPFTPGLLVRSVSGQLTVEMQRMYPNGTHDLHKNLNIEVSAITTRVFLKSLIKNNNNVSWHSPLSRCAIARGHATHPAKGD